MNSSTTPSLNSLLGVSSDVSTLLGLLSMIAVGGAGCCTVLFYARRLCQNKDFVSDCIIGKSVVHLAVDTDGNGKIETSKKLVLDTNTRKLDIRDSGYPSPGDSGSGTAVASPRITFKKTDA